MTRFIIINISSELSSVFKKWLSASSVSRFSSVDHLKQSLQSCPESHVNFDSKTMTVISPTQSATIIDFPSFYDPFDKRNYPTGQNIENGKEAQERLIKHYKKEFLDRVTLKAHGHYTITGIPGSGKTYALVSRAVYLASSNPDWRIAIVCFNEQLSKYIKKMLSTACKDRRTTGELSFDISSQIEVSTTSSIALRLSQKGYKVLVLS